MQNGWILFAIPGTSVLLASVLFLSAAIERRLLSPRGLIRGAVRARRTTPEFAEAFVARQFERILRDAANTAGGTRRKPAPALHRPV